MRVAAAHQPKSELAKKSSYLKAAEQAASDEKKSIGQAKSKGDKKQAKKRADK